MKKVIILLSTLAFVFILSGVVGMVFSMRNTASNQYYPQGMMSWIQNDDHSNYGYRQGMMPWIQDDITRSYWGPRCR